MTTTDDELRKEANADAAVSPNYYTVLYADFGKRKTTTACSMVNERGLLLTVDDSWKVLRNPRHADVFKRIKTIKLESFSQLDYIDFEPFDTVIWDPVSTSVAKYLDLLKDKASWGGKFREKMAVKTTGLSELQRADLKDLENLAPADYRVTRDTLRPHLDKLFNLSAHLIFTSHAKSPIEGLAKDQRTRPDMPGATFQILGERADIIAHLVPGTQGKFIADMSTNSISMLGKSRIEGLQGRMDLDEFVKTYKETVFK